MLRVAICDDEPVICSQIENYILDYASKSNERIETQVFYSGEELEKFLSGSESFHLIFLDIEMKNIDGVELGRKIREEFDDQVVQIVYVSGKDSYFRDLFDVRPMHFIQKPINEEEIIKDVRLAIKLSEKLGGVFTYKKGHDIYRKPVKDILYFESINREIKMVTTKGEEIFYGKLHEVYDQVAKYHFLFIHKSYIANYFFVTKFKYEELTMSNMAVLPISQPRRKVTRELQVKYEKEGFR